MSRHRRPDTEPVERTEVREVWGLLYRPDGDDLAARVLRQGYSGRELTSADEVMKDFDRVIRERGTPVLLERITTVRYDYRSAP